jgi:hypothetical protein
VLLRVITGNWLGDEKTVLVSALSLVLRDAIKNCLCIFHVYIFFLAFYLSAFCRICPFRGEARVS